MKIYEITESFLFKPGNVPANIIDFRDPTVKMHGKNTRDRSEHLVLTNDGKCIVFYYGDYNIIEWSELYDYCNNHMNKTLQDDITLITAYRNGYVIDKHIGNSKWGGHRNKYSSDVHKLILELVNVGVANMNTPIWIGNWATVNTNFNDKSLFVGKIGEILKKYTDPDRLILYHGTDTLRLNNIRKNGLTPMNVDDQIWGKHALNKKSPQHRTNSVYLTADLSQAEYYANKSVNVDKKRFSEILKNDPEMLKKHAMRDIQYYENNRDMYHDIADKNIKKAKELLRRIEMAGDFREKIEPVLLQTTLYKKDFDKLMADDDFLNLSDGKYSDNDWRNSLGKFSQIAYMGSIPPSRIKIVK